MVITILPSDPFSVIFNDVHQVNTWDLQMTRCEFRIRVRRNLDMTRNDLMQAQAIVP